MKRACWVVVLAAILIPFVFQKELAELKAISVGLFISALIFVATNVI
jgi:amino acid permease